MSSNYRIAEHVLRHRLRTAARAFEQTADGFWEGFGKPVAIVATGVALATPLAKIAAVLVAYIIGS